MSKEYRDKNHEDIQRSGLMALECCGRKMIKADDWYHCEVCGMRLRAHPHGQERAIISEMVIEEVQENMMTWKEFYAVFHELWRAGHYEDYEPNVPKEWMPE